MKFLLRFLLPLAVITSCKKEHLSRDTQNGANTFSCKINGTVFTPCNGGFFSSGPSLYAHYSSNFTIVYIGADCTKKYPFEFISIELNNFHGIGEYLLSDVNNSCTYTISDPVDRVYKSIFTGNGKVVITKNDRINFILSGTFEFTTAEGTNPSDIVTVSSGRFDLKTN